METGKKFVWKDHGKEKMQKRVVQLCTLTKISSEIGFLSVNWAIPEKRWELSTYIQLEFLGFLFHQWKFWKKTKLFIPKKSCKIIWHLLGMKPNSLFFLPLKIVVISWLYLFNIPGKSKSWNSHFRDFTWADKLLIMKFLGE